MSKTFFVTGLTSAFLLAAVPAPAATFCDDCWQKQYFDLNSMRFWSDAQCCVSGSDCGLSYDSGWSPVHHNIHCEIIWSENRGYICDKPQDCYREGGDGGSGGGSTGSGCFVPLSAPCPAECPYCERDPFRV